MVCPAGGTMGATSPLLLPLTSTGAASQSVAQGSWAIRQCDDHAVAIAHRTNPTASVQALLVQGRHIATTFFKNEWMGDTPLAGPYPVTPNMAAGNLRECLLL
jgi:nuclear transport factor 2 (NTF2) superfamily protein